MISDWKWRAVALLLALLLLQQLATSSPINKQHPSLSRLLELAGISEQSGPLEGDQVALIRQIGEIYAQEDELNDQESRLLEAVGVSPVEPGEKLQLKVMFNNRLKNALRLEQLAERLRELTRALRAARAHE